MKNIFLKTTMAVASAALFSGCSVGDIVDNGAGSFGEVGNKTDTLSVAKLISPKGFLVLWNKKAGSYGEVIYTDDLSKKRGDGYPLTSNTTGMHRMVCEEVRADSSGASFSCKPSNVSYSKNVYLKSGVDYKWLVNYGFDHEKGEVEATMTYRNGTLYVE